MLAYGYITGLLSKIQDETLTFGCGDSKNFCVRDNDSPSIRVRGIEQESIETEAFGAVLGPCKVLREKVKMASTFF